MTPGIWIARPGSDVRHLLGFHYSGKWMETRPGGVIRWLGLCDHGAIDAPDDRSADPHVADEDMHLYQPCKRCVLILKRRTDHLTEILDVAWMDIRRSEPKELVG